jgi:hypothetical protein
VVEDAPGDNNIGSTFREWDLFTVYLYEFSLPDGTYEKKHLPAKR